MNNVKMKTIVTRHHKQGVGDQEGGAQEAGSQGLCQEGGGQEGGGQQGGPQGPHQAASSTAGAFGGGAQRRCPSAGPQRAQVWVGSSIPL